MIKLDGFYITSNYEYKNHINKNNIMRLSLFNDNQRFL